MLPMAHLLFPFGFGFVLYFLPSIIALARNKQNIVTIVLLNFFLGWTAIGWIIAIVMALKEDVPQQAGYR
jgi:T4 superinfection immunity protein